MDALDRVVKPKMKTAKRFLEKREPKLNENIKNAMLIKGGNANVTVTQVLKDVYYFRSYKLLLKKSGCRTPQIELKEMGPSLDLVLRRTHLASDDFFFF
uniref:Ribosome production factor 2 homolog n=1 Tax=Cercocebus atys TaxID=9531 RepID=A0A2K5LDC0_CERAT